MDRRTAVVAALAGLVACGRRDGARGNAGEAGATTTATPITTATATATTSATAMTTGTAAGSSDGGDAGCRVLRGPIELPLRGPAALSVRGDMVDAVQNDDGRPRVLSFPVVSTAFAAAGRESWDGGSGASLSVPCAIAGEAIFCPDRSGAVHRARRDSTGDRVVASARPGSRVAAAVLARSHAALSYLASRRTSEGFVSEAWLAVDDDVPARISEDGSGATSVALAARGASVLALIVDARAALTAMHVRPLSFDGNVRLGEDAVVFVGGPGEKRTAGALAVPASGPVWALLPIGKDVRTFGLAVVRVDDPPRVDEPSSWSVYPNGLDPSPVAAAAGARLWLIVARPQSPEPGAVRILEVADLTDEGTFTHRYAFAVSGTPTHAAVAVDGRGGLWVSWADGSGSWLERMTCK